MDSHDRFERQSLRDVLVDGRHLEDSVADELMSSARETHEPFGAVVVDAGHMTAWDLAKVVSTHYQMPYLPLKGYRFDAELADGIPPAVLYQYQVLPVGRFGRVWSFAVVEPPTRDCIADLSRYCGSSLFFLAAEADGIQRLLRENIKVVDAGRDKEWQSIFDDAEESVSGA